MPLLSTDMVTVKGRVMFRKNDTALVFCGLRQWQNGKMEMIFPSEVAISKLLLAPSWDRRYVRGGD